MKPKFDIDSDEYFASIDIDRSEEALATWRVEKMAELEAESLLEGCESPAQKRAKWLRSWNEQQT